MRRDEMKSLMDRTMLFLNRTSSLRSFGWSVIVLAAVLFTGCASVSPPQKAFTRPAGMFPAEGMVVQRAVFTVYGRQFALNGYLALSPTGGKRMIITETFGNVMADVLVKPDGTVFVMRSSRMFPEKYISKLLVPDMNCVFGDQPAADCPVTMPDPNHFVIHRGPYHVDLHILDIKTGPQRADLFDETKKDSSAAR